MREDTKINVLETFYPINFQMFEYIPEYTKFTFLE